jgi:hypothetical protein
MSREQYNEYMRTYLLARYHKRRSEAVISLGGRCAVCGVTEELEIDHTDPALKSFDISKLWSVSRERFEAELEKCQVLCKQHHVEKTRREQSVDHGGGASGKRNCPCRPCKQKKAEYMTVYMASYVRKDPRAPQALRRCNRLLTDGTGFDPLAGYHAPLAQRKEQPASTRLVGGSSPSWRT